VFVPPLPATKGHDGRLLPEVLLWWWCWCVVRVRDRRKVYRVQWAR
jgi:hypothetical protein